MYIHIDKNMSDGLLWYCGQAVRHLKKDGMLTMAYTRKANAETKQGAAYLKVNERISVCGTPDRFSIQIDGFCKFMVAVWLTARTALSLACHVGKVWTVNSTIVQVCFWKKISLMILWNS